ncbi:hypothetical protein [Pelagibaculum spongiae]|uniref:Uncharacterized protein n=1 Tax=Pelagibaculum spongiae TaxID=2080658 RepID=A0A2V1H3L1_9GAMM|nr:hypothetical protein [Pelagibaculum spongiae]PVZ70226.1 hypothetical protein DC094_06385 [Pelagibaculum spongiae]
MATYTASHQSGPLSMLLLASKILITFATVVLLASVAERLGPRQAGILSGFPLGTAIALFFFGWQQGAVFAAQSAVYTLAGLASAICLAWGYLKLLQLKNQHLPLPEALESRPKLTATAVNSRGLSIWIIPAIFISLVCFLVSSWLLQFLPASRWLNLALVAIAIIFFRQIFKPIPEHKIQISQKTKKTDKLKTLFFRASIATLTILLITGLAELLGPTRAGLLAAFPISFFPLMLILHISHGEQALAATIKHYPDGLGALVVYCFSVSWLYPIIGIGWGTIVCLLLSCFYLWVYSKLILSKIIAS